MKRTGLEKPSILGKTTKEIWFEKTGTEYIYYGYQPSENKIERLKKLLGSHSYKFVVFASTTCDDCKENVSKILKILDLTKSDSNAYEIYGLDENLQEPGGYYKKFEIHATPSMFVMKNDKIIGSISYPDYEWLEVIIEILEKDIDEK